MRKEELSNPLVIVAAILSLILIGYVIKVYFFDSIYKLYEKREIPLSEKEELELLTKAYLIQNNNLTLNNFFETPTSDNRFNVAAEYYYLKNGKDNLRNYDEILSLAKQIFDADNIAFSNFEINIDEEGCGKEKFTTINGIEYSDSCDLIDIVFEINDIYESNSKYIVEFYAAKATQGAISSTKECDDFKVALSYNLKLIDLLGSEFYNEDYSKCCESDCQLEGIYPLKSEIINQTKNHEYIYEMVFSKKGSNFVFEEIKK